MDDDFREVDAFHGDTIAAADDTAIRAFCHDFLRAHDALLRRRQRDGRIRDGHGDLHAEHICCTEPPVIYDCIEFNPSLRQRDVAAEIAFLAMDLVYREREDLAERLVARYAELTHDAELSALVPFYACHRAYIRGKVDSLKSRAAEVAPAERDAARTSAPRRFALALRDTWGYSPGRVQIPAGVSDQLVNLARKHPSLQFDPQTGVAKLDTDVVFDSGNAELKPQAEQVLSDLASVLQSTPAHDMRIMIVGQTDAQKIAGKETRQRYGDNWNLSTARAVAVAGYLHKAGVAEPRMGIAGYGGQQPIASNSTPADRRRNRRVEIFVIPPDYPIVGWTETSPSLY
jgi:flagellar motor protein MotB